MGDDEHGRPRPPDDGSAFRQLLDHIPHVFWMTSLDKGEMIHVSRAYEEIWGRSCASLLERPRQWLEAIHPDDRDRVEAALPGQPEGTYDETYRIVRPDGGIRWVRDRAFPVRDDDGRPFRVAGIAEDVTDRRLRQRELLLLASAISQSGEGVIITDASGAIEYVNPAFQSITGYASDEVVGKNPRILKSGEQDDETYRRMWERLTEGRTWRGRFVNRRKDGSHYVQDSVITPIVSERRGITHYVAVLRDVTREVDLEEQVRQAQKMEAIGRLAGGIAHDFNNALTAIQAHARFALDGLGEDPAADEIREILAGTERAHNLTRQLLAFSRQQVVRPRVVEVGDVIRASEKMLRRLIGEHIRLEVSLDPDAGRVRMDPTQLHQILLNLALNARYAMPDGGRLAIGAGAVEVDGGASGSFLAPVEPGPFVAVRVEDDGCGMDAETMERIFEPFFTTKPPGEGTGLGLSTLFGIVTQGGGTVRVESEPGSGAAFEILLPRTDEPSEAVGDQEEPGDPAGSETVLVVEDQPAVRSVARRTLERAGYRVVVAEDGEAALAVWEDAGAGIDVVLTDLVMPRMGGLELADRLRELRPDVPLVFMSGYAEGEVEALRNREPAPPFVEKPFDGIVLLGKLREVLERGDGVG